MFEPRHARLTRVLVADPSLGASLEREQFLMARQHVVGTPLTAGVGALELRLHEPDGVAVALVVDGFVLRTVGAPRGGAAGQVVGPGEVVTAAGPDASPWSTFVEALDPKTPVKLLALGTAFRESSRPWPELSTGLGVRVAQAACDAATFSAINQISPLETRVVLLMVTLAHRWGHVTPEGIVLPLPLTHRVVSQLVGARRPSVTSTLASLARRGTLRRTVQGWVMDRHCVEWLDASAGELRGAGTAWRAEASPAGRSVAIA